MAAISLALAPFSANLRHAALRSPWAESPLSPARLHCLLNHSPKRFALKALPRSLTRNTRCSPGAAALMAAANSAVIGMGGSNMPVFCCLMLQIVSPRTCWRPTLTTSAQRSAVLSSSTKASPFFRADRIGGLEEGDVFLGPSPEPVCLGHLHPHAGGRVILAHADVDRVTHQEPQTA